MIQMLILVATLICLLMLSIAVKKLQQQIDKLQIKMVSQQIVFSNNQAKIEEFIKSLNRTFGEIDTELSQIRKELKWIYTFLKET